MRIPRLTRVSALRSVTRDPNTRVLLPIGSNQPDHAAVRDADVVPAPSGVRAQAVDRAGRLLDDFHIVEGDRSIHVVNAPSPAATASLSIGRYIADMVLARLQS